MTTRAQTVLKLERACWHSVAEDAAEGVSRDQILQNLRMIGEDEFSEAWEIVSEMDDD